MDMQEKEGRGSFEIDPFAATHIYYGKENNGGRNKARTYSSVCTHLVISILK